MYFILHSCENDGEHIQETRLKFQKNITSSNRLFYNMRTDMKNIEFKSILSDE